jgi:hypothetical protein
VNNTTPPSRRSTPLRRHNWPAYHTMVTLACMHRSVATRPQAALQPRAPASQAADTATRHRCATGSGSTTDAGLQQAAGNQHVSPARCCCCCCCCCCSSGCCLHGCRRSDWFRSPHNCHYDAHTHCQAPPVHNRSTSTLGYAMLCHNFCPGAVCGCNYQTYTPRRPICVACKAKPAIKSPASPPTCSWAGRKHVLPRHAPSNHIRYGTDAARQSLPACQPHWPRNAPSERSNSHVIAA